MGSGCPDVVDPWHSTRAGAHGDEQKSNDAFPIVKSCVVRLCFLEEGSGGSLTSRLPLYVCFNYVCHFVAGVSLRRKFEV